VFFFDYANPVFASGENDCGRSGDRGEPRRRRLPSRSPTGSSSGARDTGARPATPARRPTSRAPRTAATLQKGGGRFGVARAERIALFDRASIPSAELPMQTRGHAALRAHAEGRGRGTILFTGATASLRGGSGFAAFAGAKFALRALALSMARELGPKGVHVAHVVVDGAIDMPWIRENFPDMVASRPPDGLLAPDAIAESYWALHAQPRSAWTFELDVRPWVEKF
jgi:NAD(P)-dependent dehydrogenase (short-subunit alcohol dehydrogenase family)